MSLPLSIGLSDLNVSSLVDYIIKFNTFQLKSYQIECYEMGCQLDSYVRHFYCFPLATYCVCFPKHAKYRLCHLIACFCYSCFKYAQFIKCTKEIIQRESILNKNIKKCKNLSMPTIALYSSDYFKAILQRFQTSLCKCFVIKKNYRNVFIYL